MRILSLLSAGILALKVRNDTPVGKVVTLLNNLRSEVQTEGTAEAATYDKFACFCKDTTETKSDAILAGQDTIDEESARLEEQTGLRNKLQTEIEELGRQIDTLTAEMADATNTRSKELATYEATEADLSKALASLDGAINAMKTSKPALLQIRNKLRRTLALADALGMRVQKAQVLLQMTQPDLSAELPDVDYEYHSDGIITTLEDLHTEFTAKKKEVDDEETRAVNAYNALMEAKQAQKSTADETLSGKKQDKADAEGEIASAQEALTDAQTVLTDDLRYMKDLTSKCELKAREWDQRSTLRNKEIEALTSAINVIQEGVVTTDDVNKRALLQTRYAAKTEQQTAAEEMAEAELLSMDEHDAVDEDSDNSEDAFKDEDEYDSETSFLQYRSSSFMSKESAEQRAAQYLTMKARSLASPKLSALAAQVVADPFKKVKGLVQQLIERLLAESAAEATQKGWCDTELGKARQMGEFKLAAMKKLNVELEGLEAKRDQLDADVTRLGEEVAQLTQDHTDATKLRADEKDENLTAIKRAKEGLAAVSQAITILQNFYKGEHGVGGANSASVSLLQASPVDEDAPEMTSGAYQGAQAGADNVIGLLDVIKSDYERSIKSTRQAEEEAHRDFVEFDQTTSVSIGSKSTEKELKEADLAKTSARIESALEELLNERKLKDQAVKTLEELNPACVDTGMSYEERVEKRKQEIDALKNALCILGDKAC